MRYSVLLTLALTACFDITPGRDRDGDGHENLELGGTDCDDNNAFVNPDQSEACGNGIDDDCDGFIDDAGVGEVTWYNDDDGDGYPNPVAQVGCAPPASSFADLSRGVDCNDRDATVHPGAREIWYDGIDQACDGGDDFDADADGYLPIAHGGDDCDDANNEVNPGSIELCGNGLDDDCDGTPNHCELRGEFDMDEIAASIIEGRAVDTAFEDLNGDGILDVLVYETFYTETDHRLSVYAGDDVGVSVSPFWTAVSVNIEHPILPAVDLDCDGNRDLLINLPETVVGFLGPLDNATDASLANPAVTFSAGNPAAPPTWQRSPQFLTRLEHPDTQCEDLLISVGDNRTSQTPEAWGSVHFARGPLLGAIDVTQSLVVNQPAALRMPSNHTYGSPAFITHRDINYTGSTTQRVRAFSPYGDATSRGVSFAASSDDLYVPMENVTWVNTHRLYMGPSMTSAPHWWLSNNAIPVGSTGSDMLDDHEVPALAWLLDPTQTSVSIANQGTIWQGAQRPIRTTDTVCDVNGDGISDYVWNPHLEPTIVYTEDVQDTRLEIYYGPSFHNLHAQEPDAIDYIDNPTNEVQLIRCSPEGRLLVSTNERTYYLPPFGM